MCSEISYVTDVSGEILAVQVPYALWQRLERHLPQKAPAQRAEALDEFASFIEHWNFPYEYDPGVSCPNCGVSCSDWRTADGHPFFLANANFGGLLVFSCANCGAVIRQKHFKDHRAVELTLPGR